MNDRIVSVPRKPLETF